MGKGISTAEGRLNLGTEVPYEGSPPLHVEVMAKLDQPNISEPSRQRSNSQNHCAEVLEDISLLDALARWPGVIADFVEAYGELPVARSLICLTAACPVNEQAAY